MLIILCFALIVSSVGAWTWDPVTYDRLLRLKDMLDRLEPEAPEGGFYTRVVFRNTPSTYSTELDSSEYSTEPSVGWSTEPSVGLSFEDPEDAGEWYTIDSSYEVVTESGPEPEATSEDGDDGPAEHGPRPDEEYEKHHSTLHARSKRDAPGVHYPNYNDIPPTSFQCSEESYIPGFYADLETGCQVFHVCWPHRRESFLCPVGTTFNQAILACDHWYSSNCSLAPHYYEVNAESSTVGQQLKKEINVGSMIDSLLEKSYQPTDAEPEASRPVDASFLMRFLPVKAKVVVFPETSRSKAKIVAEASVGNTKSMKTLKHTVETLAEEEYATEQAHISLQPVHKGRDHFVHEVAEAENMPSYPEQAQIPVQPVHTGRDTSVNEGAEAEYMPSYPEQVQIPVQPVHTGRDPPATEGAEAEYMPVNPEPTHAPLKTVRKVKSKPVHKGRDPSITEDVEAEYMPAYPEPEHSTVQPVHKFVKSRPVLHRGRDPAVDRIIDQVFEIAKRIVKESGSLMPAFKHLAATPKMKSARKFVLLGPTMKIEEAKPAHVNPIPLTKLNPRFIVEPIHVLGAGHPKAEAFVQHKPHMKVFKVRKPVVAKTLGRRMYVSPTTKKPLSKNYLSYLIKTG